MNSFDPVTQLTKIAESSDNPLWLSPIGVIIIVGLILLAAYPIMQMYKKWSTTNTDVAKDSSESFLYKHLQEQIKDNHQYLKETREENEKLRRIIGEMEIRIRKLETEVASVENLKVKLDNKDKEILLRDATISQRELKIHELFDIILKKETENNRMREIIEALEKNRTINIIE